MSRSHLTVLIAAASLAACATTDESYSDDVQEAIDVARDATLPASEEERAAAARTDPLTRANFWSREYEKTPGDLDTALSFVTALREIGSHDRAVDIASRTAVLYPESDALITLLGRALLSQGRPEDAVEILLKSRSINDLNPDTHASLGLAFDRLERHVNAQKSYRRALQLDPERIATQSNLAMSLALSGDLGGAEILLADALASTGGEDMRIRENLALVYGLQGRFDAMREITENNAPVEIIAANEALLRSMVAPSRSWDSLTQEAPYPATDDAPEAAPTSAVTEEALTPAAAAKPDSEPHAPPQGPSLRGSLGG
ncbi:MAG: hypothetical protein AAFS13_04290 [Pseudomonadota bacterium]